MSCPYKDKCLNYSAVSTTCTYAFYSYNFRCFRDIAEDEDDTNGA